MSPINFLTILAICAALPLVSSNCVNQFVDSIEDIVTDEIHSVLDPVEDNVVDAASKECSELKKIFGVKYDDYSPEEEGSILEKLKIDVKIRDKGVRVFNITDAVEDIPSTLYVNKNHKMVIFVHGFTDDPTSSSFGNISDAFFQAGKTHVLALDASSLIRWLYLRSTTYVRFIGEKLGSIIAGMVTNGLEPANVHIIGHSLGAHISGYTGKQVYNLTGLKIGRISGLDPAGPCFSKMDPSHRLEATDATFVDAMHTDAGVFGLASRVGHVDFYPNNGRDQPNCLFQTCCHSRSWLYYAESIVHPKAFPAVHCHNWSAFKGDNCSQTFSYMGFGTHPSVRGRFYLRTGDESPFGLGVEGLAHKEQGSQSVVSRVVRALRTLANNWDKC